MKPFDFRRNTYDGKLRVYIKGFVGANCVYRLQALYVQSWF